MKSVYLIPFLLLLALFTILVPNQQSMARLKASIPLIEIDVSSYESHPTLAFNFETATNTFNHAPSLFSERLETAMDMVDSHRVSYSSLGFLYLTHSPPSLT